MVPVSRDFVLNEEFSDYKDIELRMNAYANSKGFKWNKGDSTPRTSPKVPPNVEVPEELQYYMLKIRCQRSGNYKTKGQGIRDVS